MGWNQLLSRLHNLQVEIQQDRARIIKQKIAIAALITMRMDATEAEQILLIFEKLQDEHWAEIENVKGALAKMGADRSEGALEEEAG
jgi:hypothetical protein